jgi:Domain of unknown function (DUF5753)
MGEWPSIKIQVIAAEAGAYMGLLGALAIASFAGDATGIVYFESPDEGQTTRDPGTVAKVTLTFETLRSEAPPRGALQDLILKVAGEYGRDVKEVQLQRRQLRRSRRVAAIRPCAGTRHQGPPGASASVHPRRVEAVR